MGILWGSILDDEVEAANVFLTWEQYLKSDTWKFSHLYICKILNTVFFGDNIVDEIVYVYVLIFVIVISPTIHIQRWHDSRKVWI